MTDHSIAPAADWAGHATYASGAGMTGSGQALDDSHLLDGGPLMGLDDRPRASYTLRVNGVERPVVDAWIGESLLYVLRERLGLAGAKDGCEQGECGACSVMVDGQLVDACLVAAALAVGSEVHTVEGLAPEGVPSDVQRALAESGAVQCGYCAPGMAMALHDLLERNHHPSEVETRQALCGNLCRCAGYQGALDAAHAVAEQRQARVEAEQGGADAQAASAAAAAALAEEADAHDTGPVYVQLPPQAQPPGGLAPGPAGQPGTPGPAESWQRPPGGPSGLAGRTPRDAGSGDAPFADGARLSDSPFPTGPSGSVGQAPHDARSDDVPFADASADLPGGAQYGVASGSAGDTPPQGVPGYAIPGQAAAPADEQPVYAELPAQPTYGEADAAQPAQLDPLFGPIDAVLNGAPQGMGTYAPDPYGTATYTDPYQADPYRQGHGNDGTIPYLHIPQELLGFPSQQPESHGYDTPDGSAYGPPTGEDGQ